MRGIPGTDYPLVSASAPNVLTIPAGATQGRLPPISVKGFFDRRDDTPQRTPQNDELSFNVNYRLRAGETGLTLPRTARAIVLLGRTAPATATPPSFSIGTGEVWGAQNPATGTQLLDTEGDPGNLRRAGFPITPDRQPLGDVVIRAETRTQGSNGNAQSGNSATDPGADFIGRTASFRFTPTDFGTKYFFVTIVGDQVPEPNEFFTAHISLTSGNATIGRANATYTIRDPGDMGVTPTVGPPNITSEGIVVDEPDLGASLIANAFVLADSVAGLTSGQTCSVDIAVTGGDNSAGLFQTTATGSYLGAPTRLTWRSGETNLRRPVPILVLGSANISGTGQIIIQLSNARNCVILRNRAVITVRPRPTGIPRALPNISVADARVNETTQRLEFPITLDRNPHPQGTEVQFVTRKISATPGQDYTRFRTNPEGISTTELSSGEISGRARFTGTTRTLRLPFGITDDAHVENAETFALLLSSPVRGNITRARGGGHHHLR